MLLLLSLHITFFFISSAVYRIICECTAIYNRQTRFTRKTSIMTHMTPPFQDNGRRVTKYVTLLPITILLPYQYSFDMGRPLFKIHHKYVYTILSDHSLKLLALFLTNDIHDNYFSDINLHHHFSFS